jgi:hypothetical protein
LEAVDLVHKAKNINFVSPHEANNLMLLQGTI